MNDETNLQIEIITTGVEPDSNGMYYHEFKCNTRLSSDIELKMEVPWAGFTEEELKQLRREHHLYIPTIKKIEKMLMDKNGYEFKPLF